MVKAGRQSSEKQDKTCWFGSTRWHRDKSSHEQPRTRHSTKRRRGNKTMSWIDGEEPVKDTVKIDKETLGEMKKYVEQHRKMER